MVSTMPCGHNWPEPPRHVNRGGNRFTLRTDKKHIELVRRERRRLGVGEGYRVGDENAAFQPTYEGA